ncbi:hypothetical protein EVAR_73254_1 [Eumeta japonica]|uniref:Uncharacterized protein n=1 Tax=Eumeta variegata TaxID=151549 RepID=A0A4C1T8N1_EUMVA|nr:hypothetical protein EVAR_73254_1 [Eumeta japonica]
MEIKVKYGRERRTPPGHMLEEIEELSLFYCLAFERFEFHSHCFIDLPQLTVSLKIILKNFGINHVVMFYVKAYVVYSQP